MNNKENINFPTYYEIEDASKEYSLYQTKHLYKDVEIKQIEIERNFIYAVDWVKNYLKI